MFLLSVQLFRSNLDENGSDPAQRVSVLDLFPERCCTILALQDARVILTEALLETFSANVTAASNAAPELNIIILIYFKESKWQKKSPSKKKKNQPNIKSAAVSPKKAGVYKWKISSLDATLICYVSAHFYKSLETGGQARTCQSLT